MARLAAPLIGLIPLFIAGRGDDDFLTLGLICLVTVVGAAVLGTLLARSDRTARWLGNTAGRLVSWFKVKFGKPPLTGLGEKAVDFRRNGVSVFVRYWKRTLGALFLNLALTYVLLLVSIRFLGLSNEELAWEEILAVFTLALWAQMIIPINNAGVGVADIVLIAGLSYGADSEQASIVFAAVILWRISYTVVPLALGAFTLSRWKKANPDAEMKPSVQEIRDEAGMEGAHAE